MRLSIIIPVYNEAETLGEFLPDLFDSFEPAQEIEILICDGGSCDTSVQIAQQFNCKVIHSPAGRAKQMNAGAAQANGEWLVFLHADTYLPQNWSKLITESSAQWGRFDLRLSGKHAMFSVIAFFINWRSSLTSIATGDQVLFFRREFFEALGGYPDIPLMEDIAICKAARQKARPVRLREVVLSSSRRWEKNGILKTIFLMWILRLAYWLGVKPQTLHQFYYPKPTIKSSGAISDRKGSCLLQIFARPPVVGKVKTRMIPALGAKKATLLYQLLLQQTCETVRQSQLPYQLWLSEAPVDKRFDEQKFQLQQGDDLGQRMFFALQQGLKNHDQVVLIGSDCAELTPQHFFQVSESLQHVDVVLIPAHDGGYVLIACRQVSAHLFADVDWGSDQVLQQTLARISDINFSVKLHAPLRDIDTIEDLQHYPQLLSRIET